MQFPNSKTIATLAGLGLAAGQLTACTSETAQAMLRLQQPNVQKGVVYDANKKVRPDSCYTEAGHKVSQGGKVVTITVKYNQSCCPQDKDMRIAINPETHAAKVEGTSRTFTMPAQMYGNDFTAAGKGTPILKANTTRLIIDFPEDGGCHSSDGGKTNDNTPSNPGNNDSGCGCNGVGGNKGDNDANDTGHGVSNPGNDGGGNSPSGPNSDAGAGVGAGDSGVSNGGLGGNGGNSPSGPGGLSFNVQEPVRVQVAAVRFSGPSLG